MQLDKTREVLQMGAEQPIMKARGLTIPELMLIGGTRIALGAGLGLLLAERLNRDERRAAAWALLAVGAR
jgi:hypothetical protein